MNVSIQKFLDLSILCILNTTTAFSTRFGAHFIASLLIESISVKNALQMINITDLLTIQFFYKTLQSKKLTSLRSELLDGNCFLAFTKSGTWENR